MDMNGDNQTGDANRLPPFIDYDKNGNIVGLEVLEASKNVENPRSVEYAVAG